MQSSVITAESGYPAMEVYPSGGVESLSMEEEESLQAIPPHPSGVKPAGNQYTATSIARNLIGSFQVFPDEILAIFLEYLDSQLLCALGSTCKFLYAFCRSDDLWKALFIESPICKSGNFTWRGTWRSTHLNLKPEQTSQIQCDNVFSDVLYRPFLCTHTSLLPYTTSIPSRNAIPRLANLTPSEFSSQWSCKPFILTEPVKSWPVYQNWNTCTLLEKYGDVKFRAEAVDWTLSTYVDYMNNSTDESPLYLFDRNFFDKMSLNTTSTSTSTSSHTTNKATITTQEPAYVTPTCFGEDLFSVLGSLRPAHQWLILGPSRSGSTYHKDPNSTSAWNAVLTGSKYWIMFPSITPPPGVFVSADESEVTSPLSIAEWLLEFHAEARKTPGCIEGICFAGEILHVPSGWWHLVVNIETSLALTQNFVPSGHLKEVLSFMRDKRDQVSGFAKEVEDSYELFLEGLRREYPDLLEVALRELELETERKKEGRKRKWDAVVAGKGGEGNTEAESGKGGFSFGFGDDSDVEVP
ncbi:related to phosphatidylserine-specific receptor [Rhynchosporium agropyri]|uniref:Related to phosphatidylserine-specific receptor n=1 Tax=Rhynchosporium agropyri TaxID=914238 RepID=A0A1E1K8E1_9HELO|nr:related to phosphatidylserine-specific receptor [Rhynchosporium agropyri]